VHGTSLEWPSQLLLEGQNARIDTIASSPDGNYLASGSFDKTVRIWDLATGSSMLMLPLEHPPVAITYSSDGKELVSVLDSGMVNIWDAKIGTLQGTIETLSSSVDAVFDSPDGTQLILGMNDMTIQVWDIKTEDVNPDSQRSAWLGWKYCILFRRQEGCVALRRQCRGANLGRTDRYAAADA
jgi:WD40 repeat protein